MIEQTNEIVRSFNRIVGDSVLVECQAMLSKVSRLPGIDGKAKMSKSLGNTITLGASEAEIHAAVMKMYTDPNHLRVSDPGQIEGNGVFSYLDAFGRDEAKVAQLKQQYQQGGLGDVAIKRLLESELQELLAPIRARRTAYLADKAELVRILREGTERANDVSQQVLARVKRALGLALFVL